MSFLAEIMKRLCPTNLIVFLNKGMKRRIKVRIISMENSLERDLACVFANYNVTLMRMWNYGLIKSAEQE